MTDAKRITPMMELMLEVLVARYRLGEPWWHFTSSSANNWAVNRLEEFGLVYRQPGQVANTFRAELTTQGIKEHASAPYTPPILQAKTKLEDSIQTATEPVKPAQLTTRDDGLKGTTAIWKKGFNAGFNARDALARGDLL